MSVLTYGLFGRVCYTSLYNALDLQVPAVLSALQRSSGGGPVLHSEARSTPQTHTPNPVPCTLHPAPCTLNPQTQSLNPTLNPK